MKRPLGYFLIFLAVWLPLLGRCKGGQSSTPWLATTTFSNSTATMHADSKRCLAVMVYSLAARFGLPLTFEDAPLSYLGDYVDITSPKYHPKSESDHLLVPRGGPLTIIFPISLPLETPTDPETLLEALLKSYAQSGYPGVYAISKKGAVWHIVPIGAKNSDGIYRIVVPIMNTQVALEANPARKNAGVIQSMFAEIKKNTGKTMFIGTQVSHNYLDAAFPDAIEASARDLLEQTFTQFGGHHLWLLQCSPKSDTCALNIY